eukprot:269616-Pyramimonas_sp.AAC.1
MQVLGKHCRSIFTSGPLAGLSHGAEVHGQSDHELATARRAVDSILRPSAGMRSLTSLLLLHGDPAWHGSVAPVVRYAKEVFSNQVRSSPNTLSFGVLREAWESAHGVPEEELAWKKVTGPLSALRLSLLRIQWDMK